MLRLTLLEQEKPYSIFGSKKIHFLVNVFFAFLFLLLNQAAFGQIIRGKVIERSSGLPLPFANVFINNTTQGVSSDKNGVFELKGPFPGSIELVASYVGYITEVKTLAIGSKPEYLVNFSLAENEGMLSEVELKSKRDKVWERDLKKFEAVFLSVPDDPFKNQITLLNPWVLDFKKVKPEKGPGYMEASAQEPLLLSNLALGYDIEYHLQDFRMLRDGASFKGQFYYKFKQKENAEQEALWISNRESIYINSLRDFNLSILFEKHDTLRYAVYHAIPERMDRIRTDDFNVEVGKSILPVDKNTFPKEVKSKDQIRISLPGRLEIHHLDKPWRGDYYTNVYHAISWIEAPSGYYDVDAAGHLSDPGQLVLSGYLARQRMARSLPFDFKPGKEATPFLASSEVIEKKEVASKALREKPWITTNKHAFYAGEQVWLGGRMLYQDANKADTLSRTLYVTLVSDKGIAQSNYTFPIKDGRIVGGFELRSDLSPGNYSLVAYTLWGRNFSTSDRTVLPLVISEPGSLPIPTTQVASGENPTLDISTEFNISEEVAFRPMDLNLALKDDFGNPLEGEFVLSLTDANSVTPLMAGTLESEMEWLDLQDGLVPDSSSMFPIEYGISVKGAFTPKNKRISRAAKVTLVRGELEDFGQVMSDSSGMFWASGLDFLDTSSISIAALDKQQKSLGTVEVVPYALPDFGTKFPTISYDLKAISNPIYQDRYEEFVDLSEVVVSGAPIPETDPDEERYGSPTQSVSQEQLEILSMEQILGLLRLNLTTLKFGNYNFQEQTGSPLLIVDGVSLPYLEKDEFREILLGFEPSQLKSVKAYSDNISKSQFGMAGYSGVLVIETKNGSRSTDSPGGFNKEEFQTFKIEGYTNFKPFPNSPDPDRYLSPRSTVYWDPMAKTTQGKFSTKVFVPYGLESLWLRAEGLTADGEPFFFLLKIPLKEN